MTTEDSILSFMKRCHEDHSVYPIWFSFPLMKVRPLLEKTKEWATIIPGDLTTYVFTSEDEYMTDYGRSEFAHTWKKGGWDCMRHLEIIASGCIPVFRDIGKCPIYTMIAYPKTLLEAIETNYSMFDKDAYRAHLGELREHFMSFLTCGQTMKLLWKACRSDLSFPRKILFIDDDVPKKPDYLAIMTLVGLYEAWGETSKIHVPFPVNYLFDDFSKAIFNPRWHGKGFTYTRCVSARARQKCPRLKRRIMKHIESYDLIVYGEISRSSVLVKKIASRVPKKRLWLIHGRDKPPTKKELCEWQSLGTVFVREIP